MDEFDWDSHNVGHVGRHGVDPHEAEEALEDPCRLTVEASNRDEQRWAALGETKADRLLFVVLTKRGAAIRVITARPPTAGEARRYHRQAR